MALSLRQIHYFIATAEAGKLSLAASQLGVSQSAVTEAIKALESETGVELLRRHGKGVELTLEGSQFLRNARAVVAAVSDATQAPRQVRSGVAGRFSLAMTFTVAGYFLPAPLAGVWGWVEKAVEITPGVNILAAHNVVVARKP